MLLPDPPQLHGTHNHLEHYRVAERLGVIAASGDAHAPQASTLLRLLLEEREFEATVYASLFDRSFVDAKGRRARRSNANTRNYKRRITVTAGMTSPSSLSVRISLRRYGGYGKWDGSGEWRNDRTFTYEQAGYGKRPADELLFFPGARDLTEDFSDRFRLRSRNDDLDEIRRLHAQVIVLRFWKAVLRLAFHFDVAVESYPATATNGLPRGPALEVIDAVAAYRQQTEARFKAFETTTGHTPDLVWDVCASHRSQSGHFYREEAAKALNRIGGARLTPAEIERAFSLLCTAAGFEIYAPPASLTQYAPWSERPQVLPRPVLPRPTTPRPVWSPKAPTQSSEMRTVPIEPALADELGVMSTADLVAKLNEIWKSRGEPPLPQGSYPTSNKLLASVVRLYRSELKAGVARGP